MRDPRVYHPDDLPIFKTTRCGTYTLPATWRKEWGELHDSMQLEVLHMVGGGVPGMVKAAQSFDAEQRKAFEEYLDVVLCELMIHRRNAGWWEVEAVSHVPQNVLTDIAFMRQQGWISQHVYAMVNARSLTKGMTFTGTQVKLATMLFGGFEGYAELEEATDE